MSADHLPEIVGASQVAALLNLNRKTVYEHANAGKLPFMRRVGRKWIASLDAVLAWLGVERPQDR